MASPSLIKKVSVLGSWHEDVFTDELVTKIAVYAVTEKGKKAQAKLSSAGIKITRARFLQSDKSQFYPSVSVKTVAANPAAPDCVMFILSDPHRRYQIVAVRCASPADAANMVSFMAQVKKDQKEANVEFKKRENGNWTLRERSAHNANRHMAELFSQQGNLGQPLSATTLITTATTLPTVTTTQNGDAQQHAVDNNIITPRGSYIKRNQAESVRKYVTPVEVKDDDYVIETEVSTESETQPGNVRELRGRVNSLSHELEEIKTLLHQTNTTPDNTDGARIYGTSTNNTTTLPYTRSTNGEPGRSNLYYTGTTQQQQQQQPTVYRAEPRTYEAKLRTTPAGFYANPLAAYNRRHSSRGQIEAIPGGNKVTFDTLSIISSGSRKWRPERSNRAVSARIPTTIQRNIEDTYTRPVVIHRHGSAYTIAERPRPRSYHITDFNGIRVLEPTNTSYDDVAL